MKTCVLCGKKFREPGNDPYPLAFTGRCCNTCDDLKVTPARMVRAGVDERAAKKIGAELHAAVKSMADAKKGSKIMTDETNTNWIRMELSSASYLRGTHTAWSRIADGKHIFVVHPNGETPTPTSGGYFTLAAAFKVKGFTLP
jgi:hypothetical protein